MIVVLTVPPRALPRPRPLAAHCSMVTRPPAAFDEPFPAASGAPLARGLASEDYDALASEAAERRALGDGAAPTATPYHKIGD